MLPAFQNTAGVLPIQQAPAEFFSRAILSEHLSHAFIFAGSIDASRPLIYALLKALNCPEQGCGTCGVCLNIEAQNSPDIYWIEAPETGVKAIHLDQVKALVQKASFPPIQSRYQVFILEECDAMRQEAANALLKTLEEPPGPSLFLLQSSQPSRLLPTIRSRAQWVALQAAPRLSLQSELWGWEQIEQIRDAAGQLRLMTHLESLDRQLLTEQLQRFQRECWQKLLPYIEEKLSWRIAQRGRVYLRLFDEFIEKARGNAHLKLTVALFCERFLEVRRSV